MNNEDSLAVDLALRFEGGEADTHRLDFYDGSESLFGFARTFLQSTHYLVSGQVIFHATAAKNIKLYMQTSEKGSFLQLIQMVIENPGSAVFGVLTAPAVYDFTRSMLKRTFGQPYTPQTDIVRAIEEKKEADLDALSEAVSKPLKLAHRFIADDGFIRSVNIEGKFGNNFRLNRHTKDYLNDRSLNDRYEDVLGNISSYNINNMSGRIYDLALGRTVPFKFMREHESADKSAITWSLNERVHGRGGDVVMSVLREITGSGETTRYLISDCRKWTR